MFDGVPNDQFHQFITSRTPIPIPLSFPLHGNSSFSTVFEPYSSTLHTQALHQLHHQEPHNTKSSANIDENNPAALISTVENDQSEERSMDPWSNHEVLALLNVRSGMEIWFPDFTWEHVSRKIGELGFKRSPNECKERFEEESRNFNHNKNYRIFSELDELYPADHQERSPKANEVDQEKLQKNEVEAAAENPSQESEEVVKKPVKASKKRKKKDKFEMLKGLCEAVVSKMMAQQEELHNKLIDDIVKRDDEKIAREEAWKNQEMVRIKMEIEMRSKEQATAAERQAKLIEFLKKFTSDNQQDQNLAKKIENLVKVNNTTSNSSTSVCKETSTQQNPPQNSPKTITKTSSSPSSLILATKDSNYGSGEIGKRWPRDEVLALINLRCKLSNNNGDDMMREREREGSAKGPLWERISQGMLELGYKRSAKRCKEKWENINKYFRKTKDSSKKRSLNSRTCPYFHQLSCLYNDGTIVAPPPEN